MPGHITRLGGSRDGGPRDRGIPCGERQFQSGAWIAAPSDEALAAWDGGEEPVRLGPDDDFARLENGCRDVDAPEREIEREIKRLRSTHAL